MRMKKNIFCALLGMLLFLGGCTGGSEAPTPSATATPAQEKLKMIDLTGLSRVEVEEWLTKNNITRDHTAFNYQYDEVIMEGKVISQTIPVGEEVGGRMVGVVLSNGKDPNKEITFPDFSQMSTEEIQKWFTNESFEQVSIEYVYIPNAEYGKFVEIPEHQGKARRNEKVVVRVTADPKTAGVAVTVPDMTQWTRPQVEEWCNTNTINANYTYEKNATIAQNSVIRIDPAASTELIKGDTLNVVLSDGADIQAISFYGKPKSEVDQWGEKNNIKISYIQCWHQTPSGTIFWNNPDSGTIRMGNTMQVYISVGPIPLLNFTGKLYNANFVGWFNSINDQYNKSANLKVQVTIQDSTEREDTILSQSPIQDYINPNETIYFTVAHHVEPTPAPDNRVDIPYMAGYSEYDFKRALHAYGVWEGRRTEQYSTVIAKDYIITNATGKYEPESNIDYTVSIGPFTIDGHAWEGRDYDDLVAYIDAANRMGAGVYLSPSYIDSGDPNADNRIVMMEGPLEDGGIMVRVTSYYPE